MKDEAGRERFKIAPVEPIGMERGQAFVTTRDGCGMRVVEMPVYPSNEQGARFAARRKGLGLSLREAADRLGLLPSTVSALEHGRAHGDWRALIAALRGRQ